MIEAGLFFWHPFSFFSPWPPVACSFRVPPRLPWSACNVLPHLFSSSRVRGLFLRLSDPPLRRLFRFFPTRRFTMLTTSPPPLPKTHPDQHLSVCLPLLSFSSRKYLLLLLRHQLYVFLNSKYVVWTFLHRPDFTSFL